MLKRDFARIVDKRPPTPEELEHLKSELQGNFADIARDREKPRAKDPPVSADQCAARLGITPRQFGSLVRSGELPAEPSPRAAGDRYHRSCERAWRKLAPERRRTLHVASEREPAN